ncbi:MAG: 3-oxoacyl-[acyl-carrier-protein] reductase [Anaerolineae bacterium]|nr:3-oxoacyl-[acyl-carrier-protein] reductase [Anaerolineae bacterium]
MVSLTRKVALVTGSSRGIGRAIAVELARCGADVMVNYVHEAEPAAEVAREIESLGRRVGVFQADVGDFEQATTLVNTTIDTLGQLDILVNNAGIIRDTLLMRMSETDWDMVLRVDLKGTFNTCKAATRFMLRQRSGRIINISSVSGLMGQVGQTNYAAAKAGVIGFTKSLARELGNRGITANVVAPGFIPTDLNAAIDEELRARLRAFIPLARFGTVKDVAHAVVFLASEEAAYITGCVLPVDGGLSM